jgi:F-type H+-transporting ATPase subunit delta
MARSGTAARRYAEAAFELASRDHALDAWGDGLDFAATVITDPRVAAAVGNPARPYADRVALLDEMLKGRTPDGVVRLATLLASRARTDRLPAIAAEYRKLLNRERGIVEALVTSAAPLSADETDAVRAWVARTTSKTVTLTTAVDDSLIGGLMVRVGDTLLDASVKGRLERLRTDLLTGARAR